MSVLIVFYFLGPFLDSRCQAAEGLVQDCGPGIPAQDYGVSTCRGGDIQAIHAHGGKLPDLSAHTAHVLTEAEGGLWAAPDLAAEPGQVVQGLAGLGAGFRLSTEQVDLAHLRRRRHVVTPARPGVAAPDTGNLQVLAVHVELTAFSVEILVETGVHVVDDGFCPGAL
jgi:hypothetical protein